MRDSWHGCSAAWWSAGPEFVAPYYDAAVAGQCRPLILASLPALAVVVVVGVVAVTLQLPLTSPVAVVGDSAQDSEGAAVVVVVPVE